MCSSCQQVERQPTPSPGASLSAESSGQQVVRIPAGLDDIDPLRRNPSCLAYDAKGSHRERVERHQKRGIPRGCPRLRLARGTACEAWALEHHRQRGCVACRLARRRAARPAWLLTRTGTRDRALSAPRIPRSNDLRPRLVSGPAGGTAPYSLGWEANRLTPAAGEWSLPTTTPCSVRALRACLSAEVSTWSARPVTRPSLCSWFASTGRIWQSSTSGCPRLTRRRAWKPPA